MDGDVDVAVVVGWVDTSEDPWATLGGPRHGPAGSTASQHRGHTGVGQGQTRDDGPRGAMCCVSLGGDGGFCWGHRVWHVGDGGSVGRRGRGRLLAWSLVMEDLLGRVLGRYLQREAAGIGRSGVGGRPNGRRRRGGTDWAPAVIRPSRDCVIQGKGRWIFSCRSLARTAGLGVGSWDGEFVCRIPDVPLVFFSF